MPLQKKEIEILRYKITKEDHDTVKNEHERGTSELNQALSSFRKKITETGRPKFDNFFFGESQENKKEDMQEVKSGIEKVEDFSKVDKELEKIEKPKWLKVIYKSILTRTHPDKYVNFPIEDIKEKYTRIYQEAVTAWENNDWSTLLLCAYEAGIALDNEEAYTIIHNRILDYNKKLNFFKTTIGYQWFHVEEKHRPVVLENYLKQLGFAFTKEEISDVVKSVRRETLNRKIGKKPVRLGSVKRKQ
jgi:hypothetical protein